MIEPFALALLGYNLLSFFIMGWDKFQAKRKGPRVPEKTLLAFTFLGAGLGTFIASRIFHHKTRKSPFPMLLPIGALISLGLLGFSFFR